MYSKEKLEKIKETRASIGTQLNEFEEACEHVRKYLRKIMPIFDDDRCYYDWDYDYENFDLHVSGEGEYEESYCDFDSKDQVYALKHESGSYGWYRKTLISFPAKFLYMTDEELEVYVDDELNKRKQAEENEKAKKEMEAKEKRRKQYEKLKAEFGE